MKERFVPTEYQCQHCQGRFLMEEYPADRCWYCGSERILDRRTLRNPTETSFKP